ncbi:MAG TPA: hypothetical protein VFS29_13220 [Motilibacteraceae bacterium]|nr:hypothetical protein [Motilibacteraceae bacterium]
MTAVVTAMTATVAAGTVTAPSAIAGEESAAAIVHHAAPQLVSQTSAKPDVGAISLSENSAVSLDRNGVRLNIAPNGHFHNHQRPEVGLDTYVGLSEDTVVQTTKTGVRVMAVVKNHEAAKNLQWNLGIPVGDSATVQPDGSVQVANVAGEVHFTVAKPWAVDANGVPVSTSYTVTRGALIQHLDVTPNTAYPIVADPSVSFGWYVYVHLNGTDQRALLQGGIWAAGAVAVAVCSEIGPGAVLCGAGATAAAAILSSYVGDDFHPNCTLTIKFNYWGSYAGESISNCH